MNRMELEHAIRAACDVLGVREVIVVGSQAILGQFPDAPRELRQSAEADVWADDLTEQEIERLNSIGFGSSFHSEFGFYIDPVGPETAVMPSDWRLRAIRVPTEGRDAAGICPEAHDLAISKLARGEEKDLEFVAGMLFHRLARERIVGERLASMEELSGADRAKIEGSLNIAVQRTAARRARRRGAP